MEFIFNESWEKKEIKNHEQMDNEFTENWYENVWSAN